MTGNSGNWYHKISGATAEALLRSRGADGSFLLRPSSKGSEPVLSVLHGAKVLHVKVQTVGEAVQLEGSSEQFGSLWDLVQHCQFNALTLSSSETVRLSQAVAARGGQEVQERWFHAGLSAKQAEALLSEQADGSFLVRQSSRSTAFVISVKCEAAVLHVAVGRRQQKSETKFSVGNGVDFSSVAELLAFYSERPLLDSRQQRLQLLRPLHSTAVRATSLKLRISQLGQDGGAGFKEEYMRLSQCDQEFQQKTRIEGFKAANRNKNRFRNILPYDDTRVRLQDNAPPPFTDYVNANFVAPPLPLPTANSYIACQGPLQSTVPDFWRLVWQERVRYIVMTTKEVEGGKSKCARYWPTQEEQVKSVSVGDGTYSIKLVEETPYADYVVTRLEVKLSSQRCVRHLWHVQFVSWPDHSVPQRPQSVLQLLQHVNQLAASARNAEPAPILVHCSAGIGRTGTFILLDILTHHLAAFGVGAEIDIFSATRHLRAQRPGMIQTESQYKFVYMAMLAYVQAAASDTAAEEVYCL